MKPLLAIAATLLLAPLCHAQPGPISLLQRGITAAATDSARFRLLRQAHLDALDAGTTVSYQGIDTLRLDIPPGAQPIPLGPHNDFCHTVIQVRNTNSDIFLFQLAPPLLPIPTPIPADSLLAAIDHGNYRSIPALAQGRWLIQVVDSTPWVGQRTGHTYGHYRQELIRTHNGLSPDRPAMPYSATPSRPHLFGRPIGNDTAFLLANITLLRHPASTHKTYLLNLEGQIRVTLRSVTVVTPQSDMTDDRIIRIYHCASVTLDSLTLLGTYSRTNHSGYGLLMDNCRDTRVLHLHARSNWGIFGTNNMHTTILSHCNFDRFDIHCYGRDVTFRHCTQSHSYNQFSSVVGTIAFDSCTFTDFTPLLIEPSYNAYPHFLLLMHDCRWHLTRQRHTLINAGHHDTLLPSRPELRTKCLPDIFIDGLTLSGPPLLRPLLLHYGGAVAPRPVGGIRHIIVTRLAASRLMPWPFILSDKKVPLANPVTLFASSPSGRPLRASILPSL